MSTAFTDMERLVYFCECLVVWYIVSITFRGIPGPSPLLLYDTFAKTRAVLVGR
jgi:hypothetical protein